MLPILHHRDEIIASVKKNQVTIIVGDTGSGKTTGVPQFLYEAGFGNNGMIGVTEPRRIAAISVAKFVASNLKAPSDKTVAYKIRMDDETDKHTVVKFMTDGVLLREFHDDALLSKYSVIMIDEAHERSANIDFLLGLLKQLLLVRPELRVIIASATIDAEIFARYFGRAPVIQVRGRLHNVDIVWKPSSGASVLDGVVHTVEHILTTTTTGDILAFLAGLDDINAVEEGLGYLHGSHNFVVLPVHGSLSPEEQSRVFREYPNKRKVVLATNIAETSITIDGIVYVIDTGYIKQLNFVPSVGIQSLDVCEHSQAGCRQRAGRAGRTRPGVCYRLYSEKDYNARREFTEPEIKRMSLAGLVLAMEALEIPNIKNFDFIDPPDVHAFKEAYDTLEALGAITTDKPGLTSIGKEMAALPLEPRVSRMVIEAKRFGCVENVATIAAFMSVGRSVFARPKGKEYEASAAHAAFKHTQSDMLTVLRVWRGFEEANFAHDWCFKNFLASKTLQEARNIRWQLLQKLSRSGVKVERSEDETAILRSVAAGLAYNLLHHISRHAYDGVERAIQRVYIHPGSSMFVSSGFPWVVAAEVVETSKRFARMCSVVHPEWLPEIAPARFFLGEPVLRSYSRGDTEAVVACPIMHTNRFGQVEPVGELSRRVSLEEAWRIEQESIERATRAGLQLLTVDIIRNGFGLVDAMGRTGRGDVYRLASTGFDLDRDDKYFCDIRQESILRGYAYPRFKVFGVPKPQPKRPDGTVKDMVEHIRAHAPAGTLGAIFADILARRNER